MNRPNFITKIVSLRRWLPVAVCCVPAMVVAAAIRLGLLANLRTSTEGANPIFLLLTLACPVGMGLMMWLMAKDMNRQPNHAETDDQPEPESAERLVALYQPRELIEAEIAELEAQADDELSLAPEEGCFIIPETK